MSHPFMSDGVYAIQIGLDFVCVCGFRGTHADVARHIAEVSPIELPSVAVERAVKAGGEQLRLRAKVWTDPETTKRYLMPAAFMRDVVNGKPVSDIMCAYAMRDDDTKLVTLTTDEWNTLPFFYFQEDGPAPRATARPVDVVP